MTYEECEQLVSAFESATLLKNETALDDAYRELAEACADNIGEFIASMMAQAWKAEWELGDDISKLKLKKKVTQLRKEKEDLRRQTMEYHEAFDFAESLKRCVRERYVLDLWGVRYVPKEWYDEARMPDTDGMGRVELREMIDSLKDELAVVAHERDLYRAKLGRVLDAVHEAEREAR